jgi:cyclase
LLLRNGGLYKTVQFKDPRYIGDPVNAVKIFNEKEVDELILLDIEATSIKKKPDFKKLKSIASECFMPLCYGGGISCLEDIDKILQVGVEKIAMCSALIETPDVVRKSAVIHGSSTIVGVIDFKRNMFGKATAFIKSSKINTGIAVLELARRVEDMGVGEILLNSIDRDGTMKGYDLEIIQQVSTAVKVPVIACGGAGCLEDFRFAIKFGKASAVAAGSYFVFVGSKRAVLITYPTQQQLFDQLYK